MVWEEFRAGASTILVLVVLGIARAKGADLSTTGADRLQEFFQKADAKSSPVTILSFGDSMADSYDSLAYVLMNRLVDRMGIAGYSLVNYRNTLLWNFTNGTQLVGYSYTWFTDHFQIPPGGGVWWEMQGSPGGISSDQVGLFFAAQPQGGNFTLSISTNGGPWAPVLTLNGYSPLPVGRYTNIALSPNFHRMRVDGTAGTNFIIGPQLLNSRSTGVHVAFTYQGGIGLNQVTNVPRSIRDPIFKALAPDLLIWHMKEDGSAATGQRMLECEDWWSNAVRNLNVVYVGTPWLSIDGNYTVDQNTLVRSIAQSHNRTYMDCMTPAVSYDWMRTNGYMIDGTHENIQGNTYLANFAWDSLNFFSLRVEKRLNIQAQSRTNAVLQWITAPNIVYQLQASSNMSTWNSLYMAPGDGTTKTYTNNLAQTRQFYRLRLTPN